MITFVKTKSGLQVFNKETGGAHIVSADHPAYRAISKLVLDKDSTYEEFFELFEAVSNEVAIFEYSGIKVEGEEVTYKGMELPSTLKARLKKIILKEKEVMESEGSSSSEELNSITKFLDNVLENPSHTSVNELWSFLEACSLPITSDGMFLAYKKVRYDYKDIYSNTYDNSIGQILEMPRYMVDDNRNKTCSTGFHCCSYEYLGHYGSSSSDLSRVMIVKVNPANVVSVPSDYNNQKMRVSKYEVIDEIPLNYQIMTDFLNPALEGKINEVVDLIIGVAIDITMPSVRDELKAGINFNTPIYLLPFQEEEFMKELKGNLSSDFDVSFMEKIPYEEEYTIKNLLQYINDTVKPKK